MLHPPTRPFRTRKTTEEVPVRVLVTGATGYIGGRLVPELLARGHEVVCAARTPAKLDARPWRDQVEVAKVDVFDRASLDAAVEGCDAVHFLVHSMDGEDDFAERDRRAAANVRDACAAAGVSRIVYLGGLGSESDDLSDHLRSRHEVGRVLADGPVPVTELRAAIIIGSGSASFEMLRHLVDVLPVMTTPKWVGTLVQPIAVRDVLFYLCEVLEVPETAGRIIGIGGPDVMSYQALMQEYAEVSGLGRRVILPVPVLTPGLSSLWIGLVTPLPTGLARPLVESLVNEVVVEDDTAQRLMPHETIPFREAVRLALERIKGFDVATTWASAGRTEVAGDPEDPQASDPAWAGGTVFTDRRVHRTDASPEQVFAAACSIGGARGYGGRRLLWRARGLVDQAVGGRGSRRGRRHPTDLYVGDVVDLWRVEAIDPPHLLRLRAEVKLPGDAWLEFHVTEAEDGRGSELEQLLRFHPRGLSGRLYWAGFQPLRAAAFGPLARDVVDRAAAGAR
jgi:uncharacterized protein YbjT (DUF2867 family)